MKNRRKKIFINSPIAILTLIIVISFFWIVLFPSQTDYISGNSTEQSISVIRSLRGGEKNIYPDNFDKNFHRILRKGFPDWDKRVEYQETQRKLYNSARNKLNRMPLSKEKFLSSQEKDAIAYFQGTGPKTRNVDTSFKNASARYF